MSRVLDVVFGPPSDTLRKRIERLGWFERLWAGGTVLFCIYLLTRSDWRWWNVLYVGLFSLAMPLALGPAKRGETGVGLFCRECKRRNHDPGGDVTGYTCGYCHAGALERRCFDCGRAF